MDDEVQTGESTPESEGRKKGVRAVLYFVLVAQVIVAVVLVKVYFVAVQGRPVVSFSEDVPILLRPERGGSDKDDLMSGIKEALSLTTLKPSEAPQRDKVTTTAMVTTEANEMVDGPELLDARTPSVPAPEPLERSQLWCVYEPGVVPGYGLDDVPVRFCTVVVYCCLDLHRDGVHFHARQSDETDGIDQGDQGIHHFHRLSAKDYNPTLYAMIGGRNETTVSFYRKVATSYTHVVNYTDLDRLVLKVQHWMERLEIQGLVFYYRGESRADRSASLYALYYREFHDRLSEHGFDISLVLPTADRELTPSRFIRTGYKPLILRMHDFLDVAYADEELDDDATSRTTCPAPFASEDPRLLTQQVLLARYESYTREYRGMKKDILLSLSFLANHYTLDTEQDFNELATGTKAKPITYSSMCRQLKLRRAGSFYGTHSDCLVVHRGRHWFSGFGPNSGSRLFGPGGPGVGFQGVVVFHLYADDFRGVCGVKHVLIARLRAQLAHAERAGGQADWTAG